MTLPAGLVMLSRAEFESRAAGAAAIGYEGGALPARFGFDGVYSLALRAMVRPSPWPPAPFPPRPRPRPRPRPIPYSCPAAHGAGPDRIPLRIPTRFAPYPATPSSPRAAPARTGAAQATAHDARSTPRPSPLCPCESQGPRASHPEMRRNHEGIVCLTYGWERHRLPDVPRVAEGALRAGVLCLRDTGSSIMAPSPSRGPAKGGASESRSSPNLKAVKPYPLQGGSDPPLDRSKQL